jgi:hypothetical protein
MSDFFSNLFNFTGHWSYFSIACSTIVLFSWRFMVSEFRKRSSVLEKSLTLGIFIPFFLLNQILFLRALHQQPCLDFGFLISVVSGTVFFYFFLILFIWFSFRSLKQGFLTFHSLKTFTPSLFFVSGIHISVALANSSPAGVILGVFNLLTARFEQGAVYRNPAKIKAVVKSQTAAVAKKRLKKGSKTDREELSDKKKRVKRKRKTETGTEGIPKRKSGEERESPPKRRLKMKPKRIADGGMKRKTEAGTEGIPKRKSGEEGESPPKRRLKMKPKRSVDGGVKRKTERGTEGIPKRKSGEEGESPGKRRLKMKPKRSVDGGVKRRRNSKGDVVMEEEGRVIPKPKRKAGAKKKSKSKSRTNE